MVEKTLIRNIHIVNEGNIFVSEVLLENGFIRKIGQNITDDVNITMDATGKYLFPGIIDGQVHFRDPGHTHKADPYIPKAKPQ